MVHAVVVETLGKDHTAIAVYAAIATYADRSGCADPKQSTIASTLGLDRVTVTRAVDRLRRAGVLTSSPRVHAGRKIGNEYHLSHVASGSHRSVVTDVAPELHRHARDPLSREGNTPTMKEKEIEPTPSTPHLAIVVPMPTGRLLDVPSIAEEIFEAWRVACAKTGRTILDAKRRRLIEARVKEGFAKDDLLDAVRGWKRSPFHCGANDHGKVYNELSLLLRDSEHVEKFRDLWRGDADANVIGMAASDPALAAIQRQREREGRG